MNDPSRITDPARLAAVAGTGLLDSEPEADFDRLARLAAQLLGAPAAFVTVISHDRQFIKSAIADGERTTAAGTSSGLERSFCQHAIASNQPFVVEDAREHDLVRENEAVADGVIAYAGIPLETHQGQAIGALCVVDSKPRRWTAEDIENLRTLARGAMKLIDERTASMREEPETYRTHADTLLDCVAHHLNASKAYSELVGASAPLDLDQEAAARARLLQSAADLRESFARHSSQSAIAQPELTAAVQRYLDSDDQREAAARAFGHGEGDLGALETAIQRHMDASDALRIVAMDHGADL